MRGLGENAESRKALLISIDMDDLRLYRAIHSLPPKDDGEAPYLAALERFLSWCESLGLRSTIFVVAEDVRRSSTKRVLEVAARSGHEIGCHSLTHPYDLPRLDGTRLRDETKQAKTLLEDALGVEVSGFRAPGYNLSENLLRHVWESGYAYDSSVLPSPTYFAARATVIAAMRVRGLKSASIVGKLAHFRKPDRPFKWNLGPNARLLEIPMSTAGPLSLPMIGTTLATLGWTRRLLKKLASKGSLIHVEFHAIDFMDVEEDRLDRAFLVEPALRVPFEARLGRFKRAMEDISRGGTRNLTLLDYAKELSSNEHQLPTFGP